MTPRILVTGGTGTLGRQVVPRLRDAGCTVRVLSRNAHEAADGIEYVTGDLLKNEGIEAAVDGAGIIMHCAGGRKGDDDATRNLAEAASRAGARHLVYISVVGADRIPVVSGADRAMFGYFGFKQAAERVITGSGVPWTTLRATQFHDLSLTVAEQLAAPGPGRPCGAGRREPGSRPRGGPPDLGGLPGRPDTERRLNRRPARCGVTRRPAPSVPGEGPGAASSGTGTTSGGTGATSSGTGATSYRHRSGR